MPTALSQPQPTPSTTLHRLNHELSILHHELTLQALSPPSLPLTPQTTDYHHQKHRILVGLCRLGSGGRRDLGICLEAVQYCESDGLNEEEKELRESFDIEMERMLVMVSSLRRELEKMGKLEEEVFCVPRA